MKAIYSLQITRNNNLVSGYLSEKDLLDSLLLSTLVTAKHFNKVELYCDNEALQLINNDGRNFNHINIISCLDELNWVHPNNWAFSKIHVFNLQKEPFFHIDIDAFIWNGIPPDLLSKPFFFQSIETTHLKYFNFYLGAFKSAKEVGLLNKEFETMPDFAVNTALFGCTSFKHLHIIKKYYEIALNYVMNNVQHFGVIKETRHQCILFEQLFIVQHLYSNKLVKGKDYGFMINPNYSPIFSEYPFTHFIVHEKRNPTNISFIQNKLLEYYKD
jgi:hypothetical protein